MPSAPPDATASATTPAALGLARLRASEGAEGPAASLARLLVDDALGQPLLALIAPGSLARSVRDVLLAATADGKATAHVTSLFDAVVADLAKEPRTLREVLPAPLAAGVVTFADVQAFPPRDAVRRLLDRPPLRKFLRVQVLDTLLTFGRRAASPVAASGVARGLGGIFGQVAARTGSLGSLASAVSSEVEKQIEKRAADFADTGVAAILDALAAQVSDRSRAKEQAAFRAALLDGLLEWTGVDSAATVAGEGAVIVEKVRAVLAAWVNDPGFLATLEGALEGVIAREEGRTLGEVLAELGVQDAVEAHARERIAERLTGVFATHAFASWLDSLLRP